MAPKMIVKEVEKPRLVIYDLYESRTQSKGILTYHKRAGLEVRVLYSYPVKDILKARGYHFCWHSVRDPKDIDGEYRDAGCWIKTMESREDAAQELKWLEAQNWIPESRKPSLTPEGIENERRADYEKYCK